MARTIDANIDTLSGRAADIRALSSSRLLDLFLLLNRLTLGWYVLSAGWEKVEGELTQGVGTFLASTNFVNRGDILPPAMAAPFGYAWPWLELITSVLLILGLFGRWTAAAMAAMLAIISFTLVFTGELFPRHHAIVYCTMALTLYLLGPGRYSVDTLIGREKK